MFVDREEELKDLEKLLGRKRWASILFLVNQRSSQKHSSMLNLRDKKNLKKKVLA